MCNTLHISLKLTALISHRAYNVNTSHCPTLVPSGSILGKHQLGHIRKECSIHKWCKTISKGARMDVRGYPDIPDGQIALSPVRVIQGTSPSQNK